MSTTNTDKELNADDKQKVFRIHEFMTSACENRRILIDYRTDLLPYNMKLALKKRHYINNSSVTNYLNNIIDPEKKNESETASSETIGREEEEALVAEHFASFLAAASILTASSASLDKNLGEVLADISGETITPKNKLPTVITPTPLRSPSKRIVEPQDSL